MLVIPAVDIKDGRCVRLLRGQAAQETVYFEDPLDAALLWKEGGAELIHVVDLNGALTGAMVNTDAIGRIASAVGDVRVEVGGGIRTGEDIERLLSLGVFRVVIGTVAAESPSRLRELCARFEGKVVVGVDAQRDRVTVRGWTSTTNLDLLDFVRSIADAGAAAIIYTDVHRDGALEGPNVERAGDVCEVSSVPVVASGGVSSLDDIRALCRIPLEGTIVGKALFERVFTLPEAIAAIREET